MSRVVTLSNGRKIMMLDEEAEAWELATKIIGDLKDKYNLHEPQKTPGIGELRTWMEATRGTYAH